MANDPNAGWTSSGMTVYYACGQFPNHTTPAAMTPQLSGGPVHTGGSNFLLADGHVKYLKPGVVSSGYPASNSTTAQVDNSTAAGTSNMTDASGDQFAATFSSI